MYFHKKQKWKYVLVATYIFLVLVSPIFIFTGSFQDKAESLVGWIIEEEDDRFFRDYILQLKNGEIEQSYNQFQPEIRDTFQIDDLEKVASFLTSSTDTIELVGANVNKYIDSDGTRTKYDLTYEIVNNDIEYTYILAQVSALKENNQTQITGVNVIPQTQSIKEQRKVDFGSQWLIILIAIVIPLLIVFTSLYYLYKAQDPSWLVLVMILFLTLYVTITNENFGINFSINSFAKAEGLWGPIVFNTPLPLGALIYWIRRKKFNTAKPELQS